MSTIDQLTKRYRNTTAVDGLSFEVGPGRVTGFLGPNGAGKTTTLHPLHSAVVPASSAAAGSTRRAHPKNHHQRTAPPLPA